LSPEPDRGHATAIPKKPSSIVTARKPATRKAPKPAKAEATPTRIVKARRPGAPHVPDLSPEELRQRRKAADEVWRELVRRATGKEFKREF
jgi:hypothetical protein